MTTVILLSLVGGLFSLIGGLLLLANVSYTKKIMTPLLSFAAGAFLGASFLHLLPEAIEEAGDPHPIFIATLIGFLAFFIIERALMKYVHRHDKPEEHSDHTESLPFLAILGDSLHNFIDGMVIALAYIANPALGITATLAIAAHEIPQEIGDFSILLNAGWKKWKIILVNISQSLLAVVGAIIGYYGGNFFEGYLPIFIATTAGIFIYLGASDLIPEIHHKARHKHFLSAVVPFMLSLILIWALISQSGH